MKKVFACIPLYLITIAILTAAWFAPHQDTPHALLFLAIGLVLTVFSSPVSAKFFLYLILSPWYEVIEARKPYEQPAYAPLVSVIIPAWNEEVGIVATLKTILVSSYRNVEIVIVNDGSTDNSNAVIRAFLAEYEQMMQGITDYIHIYYFYQKNAGKGTALNTGIRLSHGEVILCIDADGILRKDCILNFVRALQDKNIMAVCGNVKVGNPSTLVSMIQLFEYAAAFYSRQADAILGTIYVICGAAGAFRREVFEPLGYYSTNLRGGGEDVDLSFRMQQAGMKITYTSEAVIYTEAPSTLKELVKQRLRWTRSRFEMFRRYPRFLFSTRKGHNKFLTCLVLPLIIFNDWLYVIKMALKLGIYSYCLVSHTYHLLAILILITTLTSGIPMWASGKEHRRYVILAPIYWLLGFYTSFIEVYAICRSIWSMWRNKPVRWQNWQRQGALGTSKK